MTSAHDDWERWRGAWSATEPEAPVLAAALAGRLRRENRRLAWALALRAVGTATLLVLVGAVAWRHADPLHRVWAAGIAVLLMAGWTFALMSRLGTWTPYGESMEAFLALARARCRRRLAAVRFVVAWAAAHLAFTVGLVAWRVTTVARPLHPADRAAYLIAAATLLGAGGWALWERRRARRELGSLGELEGSGDEEGPRMP